MSYVGHVIRAFIASSLACGVSGWRTTALMSPTLPKVAGSIQRQVSQSAAIMNRVRCSQMLASFSLRNKLTHKLLHPSGLLLQALTNAGMVHVKISLNILLPGLSLCTLASDCGRRADHFTLLSVPPIAPARTRGTSTEDSAQRKRCRVSNTSVHEDIAMGHGFRVPNST